MRAEDVVKQLTTPLGSGAAFPAPPYHFMRREYLNITYRTDPEPLRAIVPEPLELDEPLVRFELMNMPDVSGLGAYAEAGQAIPARLGEEQGEYIHAMYVTSHPAIASGREMGAYPKKLGSPRLFVDSDTLVGLLDYGTLRVAAATMGYKHRSLDPEEARREIGTPMFMLKLMRGYDGRPRIAELTRSQITRLEILEAWEGPARLELFAHALAPLGDLPVREVISAHHIITNLRLAAPEVAHDYLAQT